MPLSDADSALGRMEVRTYVSESGMPQKYRLTIRSREHSGDGHFSLSVTTRPAAGECRVDSCSGRRFTLRGMAGDNNATVWQLIAADKDETIHLLRRNDETLVLLNERLEKSSPEIRLHLTSEGPALHAQ